MQIDLSQNPHQTREPLRIKVPFLKERMGLDGNQYTLNAGGTGITYQMVLSGLYARGVQ